MNTRPSCQSVANTRSGGRAIAALLLAAALALATPPRAASDPDEGTEPAEPAAGSVAGPIPGSGGRAATEEALARLDLPGVTINLDERCIDLDSIVVLHDGALELVACRVGTKEHESIVAVKAQPMHIHTALLLLGTPVGNPSMWRRPGEAEDEPDGDALWVHVPPRGGKVDVSLVIMDEDGESVERPISEFIAPHRGYHGPVDDDEAEPFPTSTFLFTGSHLQTDNDGRRRYLGDISGNVITVVSFGDEVLGLPMAESAANTALMWQVDPTHLPPLDSEVVLRLRPQLDREAVEGEVGETLQDATEPPPQPGASEGGF